MSLLRLILLSLRHFWKMNVAVACGVAVGTAVLTGALLVGDSMRGSLRDLVLAGLGDIDEVLVADHFFREQLADDSSGKAAAPVILQIASVEAADRQSPAKVDQVNLIGCDDRFWQLGNGGPRKPPGHNEIVLNAPLARLLAVKDDDSVLVTIAKPGAIPAESAMGRKRASTDTMRLRVSQVIAAEGLGRFGLRPNQRAPLNAYVALSELQEQLQETGRVNAILRPNPKKPTEWHPQLADYGIRIEQSPLGYIDITTERLIFSPKVEWAVRVELCRADIMSLGADEAVPNVPVQPVLTYLANSITLDGREVPYSTITAIDFQAEPPLGPFLTTSGTPAAKLGDSEIALNDWAADKLKAKVGDELSVTYYEPESTTGILQERTVKLKLAAVIKLAGAAADKRLTPTVRGLTDKDTIEDWDLPFEIKPGHIKIDDDRYWRKYAATPKAFVSLATGRRLWASRFGQTTSLRVRPAPGMTAQSLAQQFEFSPTEMGFVFQPVKELALKASSGTTPFGVLFLSFSFFVIAAAVMLVLLLFRLGIQQRAKQLGLMLALGFRRRQAARLLLVEGIIVAGIGSLLGTLGGVGYAALMLLGLRTWWLPAIGTPFLTLHVGPASPLIGFVSGLALAAIAIWCAVWQVSRIAPRRLLAGETSTKYSVLSTQKSVGRRKAANTHFAFFNFQFAILLLLALAPPLLLILIPLSDQAKVGAFFGAGSWTLVILLVLVYRQLRRGATGPAVARGSGNLLRMATRNAARNPGRSALAIGLTAAASFIIAAVSVFRVDPARETLDKNSGSGGFALIGESTLPIYYDLSTRDGRKELGANKDDAALLAPCHFYSFRVKPGDEASCLNLYQAKQPRMLGAGKNFIDRGGFAWANAPAGMRNPWDVLNETASGNTTNTVLDQTTANYSLNKWKGLEDTIVVTDARDHKLTLAVAGLLQDSVFQGDLLVGETALRRLDPDVAGYRYFLIDAPADKVTEVQQSLQRLLGDYGFRSETTAERLSMLASVENTYLATFQSLGGLGLLLGTIGLAVVQWRNVLERRGELALLRAAGYRVRALSFLVAAENIVLLVVGLLVGIVAALVAVLPQLLNRAGSVPWESLGTILAAVLITGLLVSLAAMRSVVRTPILSALREEK
jgi:ABC-type antimicrobial peptide transport system permease subunit